MYVLLYGVKKPKLTVKGTDVKANENEACKWLESAVTSDAIPSQPELACYYGEDVSHWPMTVDGSVIIHAESRMSV